MAYCAAIKKDVEIDSTQQDSYGIVKWKKSYKTVRTTWFQLKKNVQMHKRVWKAIYLNNSPPGWWDDRWFLSFKLNFHFFSLFTNTSMTCIIKKAWTMLKKSPVK